MQRLPSDDAFLAAAAALLDQSIAAHGLTSGGYLVLRETADGGASVDEVAERLGADTGEVAAFVDLLDGRDLVGDAGDDRRAATPAGRALLDGVDQRIRDGAEALAAANPSETTTVGALAIAMRAGRFGVDELLELLGEGGDDGAR